MENSDLIKIAEGFLKLVTGELDPYTKNKGQISITDTEVTLFTPSHIQFAKYGRGPGKQPPLNNIIKWLEEDGKIAYEDVRSTAFAIAKSIGQKGTVNYQPNAPNVMDEAITKYLSDFLEKANNAVTVTLLEETREIQYFPEEIVMKV